MNFVDVVLQTAATAKELEQYYSEAQIWLELLEEEVKQGENLKEEDFQEDKVSLSHTHTVKASFCWLRLNNVCVLQDCEEGAVKDLLLKGENLQRRVPDQDKREQIRLKQNQLNSKYNTVKVTRSWSWSHSEEPAWDFFCFSFLICLSVNSWV